MLSHLLKSLEHPTISLAALKMLAGRLRRHAELVEALSKPIAVQ